jgi:hypothetical protein
LKKEFLKAEKKAHWRAVEKVLEMVRMSVETLEQLMGF